MIIVTKIPECTTHSLWCPEKDKEWIWHDQHDHGHQHARMHNSLPMISRAGQRMDMEWSPWLQSPTCQNAQLTSYDFQSITKNGHGMISRITVTNARMHNLPTVMTRATQNMHITLSAWSWSSTCQNAQLTFYDFQSRTNNEYGMISIIIVTKIPKCTTHCLWFPEKDKEWTWDDQHDHSDQHARMHNSLPMNPEQVKEWTWND